MTEENTVTVQQSAAGARPASEITGIRSAVTRMEQIAAQHQTLGSGEGFIGSLSRMEVGDDHQQKVRDAQEASGAAGAAWAEAAAQIAAHNLPLHEAYLNNPNAANKHANTNE
ncbi:hypothetical protein [Actinoplanes missouriensis]|uniref:hypothetical protein n=1 Tax=Actinoplanes missouriensis TaxID=1866 RepID=UPI000302E8DD